MGSIAPAATPIPQAAIIGGNAPMAANVSGAPSVQAAMAPQGTLPDAADGATIGASDGTIATPAAGTASAISGASAGAAALPKPPSTVGTILKSALGFGVAGAAAGAGVAWLAGVLPFTLPLALPALPIMAAIGGAAGLLVGAFRGFKKAKAEGAAYEQSLAAAQLQQAQAEQAAAQAQAQAQAAAQSKAQAQSTAPADGAEMGTDAAPDATVRTYRIKSGDTLSSIGGKLHVDWHELYTANKHVIGANPNMIHPGTVLHVPAGDA